MGLPQRALCQQLGHHCWSCGDECVGEACPCARLSLSGSWCAQVRVLCDGLIQTLGRVTYGGKMNHPFTAHPKIDPKTGEP